MASMRLAAIDIGTSSVHMIVAQVRPDQSLEIVDREKEMVRLGAGGLDGRALTPAAMAGCLDALSKFRRLARGAHRQHGGRYVQLTDRSQRPRQALQAAPHPRAAP